MSKRALLIGVNGYDNAQDLHGCLNDVALMSEVLTGYGFAEQTLVVDPNNTRDEMLDAFEAFVAKVAKDDEAVVFYSGHGSQVLDVNGDEPDGRDETIVPRDSGRDEEHPVLDVTDDEINSFVRALEAK